MAPRPCSSRLLAKWTPLVSTTPAASPISPLAAPKGGTKEETKEGSIRERARPLTFRTQSRFLIENSVY